MQHYAHGKFKAQPRFVQEKKQKKKKLYIVRYFSFHEVVLNRDERNMNCSDDSLVLRQTISRTHWAKKKKKDYRENIIEDINWLNLSDQPFQSSCFCPVECHALTLFFKWHIYKVCILSILWSKAKCILWIPWNILIRNTSYCSLYITDNVM